MTKADKILYKLYIPVLDWWNRYNFLVDNTILELLVTRRLLYSCWNN